MWGLLILPVILLLKSCGDSIFRMSHKKIYMRSLWSVYPRGSQRMFYLLLRFSVGALLVWCSNERFQSFAGRLLHFQSLYFFLISGPFSLNKHSHEIQPWEIFQPSGTGHYLSRGAVRGGGGAGAIWNMTCLMFADPPFSLSMTFQTSPPKERNKKSDMH